MDEGFLVGPDGFDDGAGDGLFVGLRLGAVKIEGFADEAGTGAVNGVVEGTMDGATDGLTEGVGLTGHDIVSWMITFVSFKLLEETTTRRAIFV